MRRTRWMMPPRWTRTRSPTRSTPSPTTPTPTWTPCRSPRSRTRRAARPRPPPGGPDLDPLQITAVSDPAGGTTAITGGGTGVDYTPDPDFAGADSFTYTISDG